MNDEADRLIADNPGVQGLAQLGRNAIERVSELERELARERETNAVLRRDLADPPPDVQELALKRCGHFEIVSRLQAELAAAVAERDRLSASIDDDFSGWRTIERRWRIRAERAEARLAAIDAAPTVATVIDIGDEFGENKNVSFYDYKLPPIGTELIAKPAKEET